MKDFDMENFDMKKVGISSISTTKKRGPTNESYRRRHLARERRESKKRDSNCSVVSSVERLMWGIFYANKSDMRSHNTRRRKH